MLACFSCRSEALAVPLPLLYGVIRVLFQHTCFVVPPKTPDRGSFQRKTSVRIATEAAGFIETKRNEERLIFSLCAVRYP